MRERLLVVSDIAFDARAGVHAASPVERMLGREGDLVMVNGQVGAVLAAGSGERERWRLVNACSSRFLRLRLDGQRMQLLGIDAGRYTEPRDVEEFVLAPGNRADILVTAAAGDSMLRTLPFDRGGMGMMRAPSSATTGADLVRFAVRRRRNAGRCRPSAASAPTGPAPRAGDRSPDAHARHGRAGRRGNGQGASRSTDGPYDHARVDTEVRHGAIEEWTIVNTSTMDHPFHLHVWPMQLVEVGGTSVVDVDWRDVVPVRARDTTVVRIAFDGVLGTTVYHCHILDHEDNGMMGIIRVA